MILKVLGLLIIVGGVFGYVMWEKYVPQKYVNSDGTYVDTITNFMSTTTPQISMADVATHNTKASCFTVISEKVYDVTLWVNLHPGGKGAILSMCGADGTDKFMKRHKGGKKFMDILTRFQIGVLKP